MEDGTRRTGSGRRRREDDVAKKISRRKFLAATGAATAIAQVARPDVAQQNSVKIGLMTVKTGGLAAGGVHLKRGSPVF
jgi:branched-chain amino acid transport system substrate-binding protein